MSTETLRDEILAKGYDLAAKAWADGKPSKGWHVLAWVPGKVRETSVTTVSESLEAALETILGKLP